MHSVCLWHFESNGENNVSAREAARGGCWLPEGNCGKAVLPAPLRHCKNQVQRCVELAYRAIGEEDAVWVHFQDLAGWVVSRYHSEAAAKGCQPPENVVLDAIVVRHNLQDKKTLLRRVMGYQQDELEPMAVPCPLCPALSTSSATLALTHVSFG